MIAEIIEQKKDEITTLCRKYRVRRLYLFGSGITGEWDPETSDFDFLVDMGDYSSDYANRFFSLHRELAAVTGRDIDLASTRGLGDEQGWFCKEVEATRVIVYDARHDQLVA